MVLAGQTDGSWNATSAGVSDWAAMKLDANGAVVWKWQVRHGHFRFRELLALCEDIFHTISKANIPVARARQRRQPTSFIVLESTFRVETYHF